MTDQDHRNIFAKDPALDYIMYKKMAEGPPLKGRGGCFGLVVAVLASAGGFLLVLFNILSPAQ